MKGNDGTGNIPERDLWQTEQGLFDHLNKLYGFTFDCCASQNNTKCELWTDDLENTAIGEDHITWMNPPFSKAKEMFNRFFKITTKGVAIYRCDNMETRVWQEIILKNASWIFIPKGRIFYEGMEGKGPRFPSALIGYNVEPLENIEGVLLFLK